MHQDINKIDASRHTNKNWSLQPALREEVLAGDAVGWLRAKHLVQEIAQMAGKYLSLWKFALLNQPK